MGGNDVILGDNGKATFSATGIRLNVHTTDPGYGGMDIIAAGDGNNIVMGGTGSDHIFAGSLNANVDILLGDSGNVTFTEEGLLYFVQNSGGATFTCAGVVYPVQISEAESGRVDVIDKTGNGPAVIMGGYGNDFILLDPANAAKDVVIADYGRVQFNNNGEVIGIFSTDPGAGGDYIIYGDAGRGIANVDLFFQLNQSVGLLRLGWAFDNFNNNSVQPDTDNISNRLAEPLGQTYLANAFWNRASLDSIGQKIIKVQLLGTSSDDWFGPETSSFKIHLFERALHLRAA